MLFVLGVAGLAAASTAAAAHEPDTIVVYGRGIDLAGEARTASEGIVGYADFENRPFSRPGELIEVIPGVVATQHSGEGKANQYFLRGFNLDHGTDFAVSVEGMPVNLPSHGHGQGYVDINFLIPETVRTVTFRKGPGSVDAGDFSSAGSSDIAFYDRLPGMAEFTVGEFGLRRAVAIGSQDLGENGHLLLAGEIQEYDGPWVLEQDLTKFNGLARYIRETAESRVAVSLLAYDSEWTSTDQVPERAIGSGLIDRFGFIDDDLGGSTSRVSLIANAESVMVGGLTKWGAYVSSYEFELRSNFTYFLEDPVDGDEFQQVDDRVVSGASVEHLRQAEFLNLPHALRFGGEVRYDAIAEVGLFESVDGRAVGTIRQDEIDQLHSSVFAESRTQLSEALRLVLGLRADRLDVDVEAVSLPANSGEADDTIVSPSLSLAYLVGERTELYANYGQGFHSNDARGATIAIDPASGGVASAVPLLVRAEGAEFGARLSDDMVDATATVFWLDLDSELVFVGDGGATEPNDATRRYGVELTGFLRPTDWLVIDAAASYTDARFVSAPNGEDRIPGAVENVVSGGVTATYGPWIGSMRLRHFGEAPLIEDGSVTSDPTTLVNLRAGYMTGEWTAALDVLNLFDSEDADITYFYESQLAGETNPVADRHFHPVEPRQFRVSLRRSF